jgi:hypothetical protein
MVEICLISTHAAQIVLLLSILYTLDFLKGLWVVRLALNSFLSVQVIQGRTMDSH